MLHLHNPEYHSENCGTQRHKILTKMRSVRYITATQQDPEGVARYEAYAASRRKRG